MSLKEYHRIFFTAQCYWRRYRYTEKVLRIFVSKIQNILIKEAELHLCVTYFL